MVIEIDGQRVRTKVLNAVKVIFPADENNMERHITITHEGIIVDIIDDGGSVVESTCFDHEDMKGFDLTHARRFRGSKG